MSRLRFTALLAAGCFFLGCGSKDLPAPAPSSSAPPAKSTAATPAQPDKPPAEVDTKGLPTEGPGDAALTYDVVAQNPGKQRGKRVTWSFEPCSSEGKRMMCALNMNEAMGPQHSGIYVVEFASNQEASEAFRAAAFKPGTTITGTVAGQVDQFLVVRDAGGAAQKDIPKVTVPLLLFPSYVVGKTESGKKG